MKNKEKIIIGSIIVILLLIITLGILYFTTDLFKTEQQLFYKYLGQTEIIDSNFIEQYNKVHEKINNNSNSSKANLDFFVNDDAKTKQKVFSITSNGLENKLLKQSYRDFNLSMYDQNFLTLRYIKDDNTYGIMADNIVTKYLAVENSNLKSLFAKLGAVDTTAIPDSVTVNNEEIFKVDEETLKVIKDTYANLLYNNISEDIYYKVKNEDKSLTIGLSLTEKETVDILKLVLETVQNDNVLLEVIVNKLNSVGNKNITIDNIKEGIQELIDSIPDVTNSGIEDFINISFDLKNKRVIRLNLEINYQTQYEDYNGQVITNDYKNAIKIDFSEQNKVILDVMQNDEEITNVSLTYSYNNEEISFIIENNNKDASVYNIQYLISDYNTNEISQKINIDNPSYNIQLTNLTQLKEDINISKLTTENSVKLNDLTQEQLSLLFTALGEQIQKVYVNYNLFNIY